MPDRKTLARAAQDKRQGKAPSTQAGEFVREEIEHVRKGKHGARSARQAIAIGLSKARRAGVDLPPPKKGQATTNARGGARRAVAAAGANGDSHPSHARSRAATQALRREPRAAASKRALAVQARTAARKRTAGERAVAARKAAVTKGATGRSEAARKAARTRAGKRAPG